MTIRPYTDDTDLDILPDIWPRAAKNAHPFIEGEGENERLADVRDVYFPNAESWVVLDETNQLVGCANQTWNPLLVDALPALGVANPRLRCVTPTR